MKKNIAVMSVAFAAAVTAVMVRAEEQVTTNPPTDISRIIHEGDRLSAEIFHDKLERTVLSSTSNPPFYTIDNVRVKEVADNRDRPGQRYLKSHRELFCSYENNGDDIVIFTGDADDGMVSWSGGSYNFTPYVNDSYDNKPLTPDKKKATRMTSDANSLEDVCHDIANWAHKLARQQTNVVKPLPAVPK